jgi:GT2 family glycosyltransferase
MKEIAVSVIVVSRHRPQALLRCLTGLRQLYYRTFEVIVVADPDGIKALRSADVLSSIKHATFDEPNISAARNIGLGVATGDIVAFIDDDAVPEPTWLTHLIAPFAQETVNAAGGFVRGRNGISFQSKARRVNNLGVHKDIALQDNTPVILAGTPGNAIKTEGTNCAFRRDTLLAMGGFDPAFHFYLDETDLNLRLAKIGANTAIVPLAEVHHGFASSAQRRQSRMPKTLFDVGASLMVFLRKHADVSQYDPAIKAMRAEQKARLIRHMIDGTCEPGDVLAVMKTLENGFAAGAIRDFGRMPNIASQPSPFQVFETLDSKVESLSLAGRPWSVQTLRKRAAKAVASGKRVSLFCFSPTARYHRVSFESEGYWFQTGGLFGRSERSDPLVKYFRFSQRLHREKKRLEDIRNAKSG